MAEDYLKKIIIIVMLTILLLLTFFLLKPILLSIIIGIILAYIFTPVYKKIIKFIKSPNISALIICISLLILIIIPSWFLIPVVVEQSIKIYFASQQIDFITPLKTMFPSFFTSQEFTNQVSNTLHTFVTKITSSLMNSLSNVLLNFTTLALQLLVVVFTFFFVLRDGEQIVEYIQTSLPFPKDVQKKFFDYTKGITSSVIYGQIIIGILQGIIVGIGLFIFNVPNAAILTFLAVVLSIFPMLGPFIVWVPVVTYLLIAGNITPAWGVAIFGIISSTIDNFIRPIIISKATKIHSAIIFLGMVGGLFLFGVLGLILGPLILAYLLIVLEIYRNKKEPGFFIQEEKK